MIKSWSFTRLQDFLSCKFKAYLKYVERVPDPTPRPAADRGTVIHTLAEEYVLGKLKELPQELAKFKTEFFALREAYKKKHVSLEGEWGFTTDWAPATWKAAWGRIKADAVVHQSPTEAIVIDYKTGKKFGNEVKHAEQLQLYTLAVFLREPEVQIVTAELWYLDLDDLTPMTTTRGIAMGKYLKYWDQQAHRMTKCTAFPPNPNVFSCKWCPYKPSGTGHCKVGV